MKYLFSLWGDEARWGDAKPEELQDNMKRWDAFTKAAMEAGVHRGGEGLEPSAAATTVAIPVDGEPIVTDGPFAETKEQLGGYYLLDCRDIDDAIEWAKKMPMFGGTVEVRPVMDYEAAGSEVHWNEKSSEG
jgi:hypothetical protein